MVGLLPKIHYSRNQTDVDTIEEIAMTSLAVLVCVTDAAEINLPDPTFLQPCNGLFDIVLAQSPEMSEVVHVV